MTAILRAGHDIARLRLAAQGRQLELGGVPQQGADSLDKLRAYWTGLIDALDWLTGRDPGTVIFALERLEATAEPRPDEPDEIPSDGLRMTRTLQPPGIVLGFHWHGGAYIDVCRVVGQAWGDPKEVINVWANGTNEPRYPRTRAGMRDAVDSWIRDYGRAALVHDVTNNW